MVLRQQHLCPGWGVRHSPLATTAPSSHLTRFSSTLAHVCVWVCYISQPPEMFFSQEHARVVALEQCADFVFPTLFLIS